MSTDTAASAAPSPRAKARWTLLLPARESSGHRALATWIESSLSTASCTVMITPRMTASAAPSSGGATTPSAARAPWPSSITSPQELCTRIASVMMSAAPSSSAASRAAAPSVASESIRGRTPRHARCTPACAAWERSAEKSAWAGPVWATDMSAATEDSSDRATRARRHLRGRIDRKIINHAFEYEDE